MEAQYALSIIYTRLSNAFDVDRVEKLPVLFTREDRRLALVDDVLRAADRVRRVGRYDLAGDVKHPHCCEWTPNGPP